MAKKRVGRTRRGLRLVPHPSPAAPTFADLVLQARAAWNANAEEDLKVLFTQLDAFPETKQVATADPQTLYFALAAWYWQLEASVLRDQLVEEEHRGVAVFRDAVAASRVVMAQLIQRAQDRLGATGAENPSLQDVCHDFLTQIEDEMFAALAEAEEARTAAREAREAAEEAGPA